MRIRLAVARVRGRFESRLLTSKLERMAEELGPVSFRTPEFLYTEMRLALTLARLAEIEHELGEPEEAERAFDRAEQIFMAMRRFLPHAELDAEDRDALEMGMERLRGAVTTLAMAA